MKRILALLTGGAAVLLFMIAALCARASFAADDTSDLWDVKQGCQITGTSGVVGGSDIRNMFGGSYGTVEIIPGGFRTLFKDGFGDGYTHWVAWKTPTPIHLFRFTLYLQHDSPPANRSIKEFRLYASQDGITWGNAIYAKNDFHHPYVPQDAAIDYSFKKDIVAQYFKAEFIQYDGQPSAGGPRVLELNGYGKPVGK